MNKSEALAVLRELSNAVMDSARVTSVSLDGSQVSHIFTGGYQIQIKCDLDADSKNIMRAIAKKYDLTVKEENGYIVLRARESYS